jgi:hypothetical protein
MPIAGVNTWLPTIDEFVTHWTAVNAFLAPGAFTLSGGYALTSLQTDRTAVDTAISNVEGLNNLLNTARGDRDIRRAAMLPRLVQFNSAVRGQLPGSRYIKSLSKLPNLGSSPGVWRRAMDDVQNLWTTINANSPPVAGFTPPLVLAGNYAILAFTADNTALDASFTAVEGAEQNDQQGRAQRDAVFAPVYERLRQYRLAILAALPTGNPLLETVPRLTPPPGSTPKPAVVSFVWNSVTNKADLTWTHPNPGSLQEFELQACPPPKWDEGLVTVVDNYPNTTFNASTDFGLAASGSQMLFAIVARSPEGNVRRSNVVKVTRP